MTAGRGSGSGSDDDPMESSRATRQPLAHPPEQHFRPTVRAPNNPLPPAAHKPGQIPRPAIPSDFDEDEAPTSALPRPPRLPDAHGKPPPMFPADPAPPPLRRDDSRMFRDDSRLMRGSAFPANRSVAPRGTQRPRPSRMVGRPGEPTVLLVGATEGFAAAIEPALARHRVYVERSTSEEVSEMVMATAPDLVVLTGDAARDSGNHILKSLALSPQSSVVPVALLDDDTELEGRLRAFRHGAAAVIPRSASMDEMADRIASLAREIPERERESLGDVGEATLQDLVEALGKELRTGILSVRAASGSESDAVRIVLGGGRALTETIDDFVARVREHVVTAEPLKYEFDERAAGTVQLLGGRESERPEPLADVAGLRVVLADDDAARADAVAQELRQKGVEVVVTDLDPSEVRFHRIRTIDPAILLIGDAQARGAGFELMRRMRRDTRLRWASLLVVRWDEVWSESSPVPAVDRILGTLSALAEPERALRERSESRVAFDTRLEITGPARMLRALAASSKPVRVTVQNPRLVARIDVSEGLVVGATAENTGPGEHDLSGPSALAGVLVVSSGRVHVEPTEQPATTNMMATPDVALNLADAEPPPIPPSIPTPAAARAPEPRRTESVRPRPRSVPPPPQKKRSASPLSTVVYAIGGLVAVLAIGSVALFASRAADAGKSKTTTAGGTTTAAAPATTTAAPTNSEKKPSAPSAKPAPPDKPPPPVSAEEADAWNEAPSCAKVLGPMPPAAGVYPGAAYDALRAARKGLVRGDMDAAQGSYCMAIRFDPKNAEGHAGLARLLLSRRDPRAAVDAARDAVRLNPEEKGYQLLLGDALALGGDTSKAIEPILLGSGIGPADSAARDKLILTELKLGEDSAKKQDHSLAERAFRRASVLDPKSAVAAAGVARALLEQGLAKAAVHWGRRAVGLDPASSRAQLTLGDALAKDGDRSAAARAWKKAVELDPNDAAARARAITTE